MARPTPLAFTFAMLAAAAHLAAQTVATKDPQALAAIQSSIAAQGGLSAVSRITNAVVSGTMTPTQGSPIKAGSFTWKDAPPEFRDEVVIAGQTNVFVSGHGQPATLKNGKTIVLSPHVAAANAPFHLPAVLLERELVNQRLTIVQASSATLNGKSVIQVKVCDTTDVVSATVTPHIWYFDSSTGLPLRVEYRIPANNYPDKYFAAGMDFSDFRQVLGILVPFQIVAYEDGVQVATATISFVAFNQNLDQTQFDLPTGGAQ